MADVPQCPNFLNHDGSCERSDLRLLGENENMFSFHCFTCKLCWGVSKHRTKLAARHENRLREVAQMTEAERAKSKLPKVFYNAYDASRGIIK